MTTILFFDGTQAPDTPRSVVGEGFRKACSDRGFDFFYVDYPAEYGPATGPDHRSLAESIEIGVTAARKAVDELSKTGETTIILGGYSQGAMVAVQASEDSWIAQKLTAVACLANPYEAVHGDKSGIAGARTKSNVKTFSTYVTGDMIADLPLGSPLRTIADLSSWMSLRSPAAALKWADQVVQTLLHQRTQAWWAPWRWGDIDSSIQYVIGYLGTKHTTEYLPNKVSDLASAIDLYVRSL